MALKAAVIMGSDSDWPVVKKTVAQLKAFGIITETHVMSAHRTPQEACTFSENAEKNGFGVIIAAAGMAAHLAGVLAAHTTLPVIGLPLKSAQLDGMDALLSTVMIPPGVPVATVGIDAAANAGVLAAQILALTDPEVKAALARLKQEMAAAVREKDAKISLEASEI